MQATVWIEKDDVSIVGYLSNIQCSTYDVLLCTIFKQLHLATTTHNHSNNHELREGENWRKIPQQTHLFKATGDAGEKIQIALVLSQSHEPTNQQTISNNWNIAK
jgi:hypothetical protein